MINPFLGILALTIFLIDDPFKASILKAGPFVIPNELYFTLYIYIKQIL